MVRCHVNNVQKPFLILNMYFTIIKLLAIATTSYGLSYKNHALLHGIPNNERELQFFNDMVSLYNVTFWRRPGKVMGPVEFTLSPYNYQELMIDTYQTRIRFRTITEDVQSLFDEQVIKRYITGHLETFDWYNYYSLNDIYDWLKEVSVTHPDEMQLLQIGKSYENRDIFAVKLKLHNFLKSRPKVIIEGGIHGREWISPAVVTYLIYALLNKNNSNSAQLKLVAPMFDWYFVPVLNPDGYVYSQTTDRLWHKNRRDGYGVDLNRNFGVLFGRHGANNDKHGSDYCGEAAFSEPESAAMASFSRDYSFDLEYYLSFHSYGQFIIIPYSFSKMYEDNYRSTKELGDIMAHKISRKYQVQYKVGTNYDTQGYLASGVSADWVKRALNVTHVASIMLPDTGVYGFALPVEQILPTCQATLDGLLAFLDPPHPEDERAKLTNSEDADESDKEFIVNGANVELFVSKRVFFLCMFILYISRRF